MFLLVFHKRQLPKVVMSIKKYVLNPLMDSASLLRFLSAYNREKDKVSFDFNFL